MVRRAGEGIQRITNLEAKGAVVKGTVRSQSGLSDWSFKIDFNDYGELTGNYWITAENSDSVIPKTVAKRIAQQIRNDSDCHTVDDELPHEESQEEGQQFAVFCPYCGKRNQNVDAKFCLYCGKRFKV